MVPAPAAMKSAPRASHPGAPTPATRVVMIAGPAVMAAASPVPKTPSTRPGVTVLGRCLGPVRLRSPCSPPRCSPAAAPAPWNSALGSRRAGRSLCDPPSFPRKAGRSPERGKVRVAAGKRVCALTTRTVLSRLAMGTRINPAAVAVAAPRRGSRTGLRRRARVLRDLEALATRCAIGGWAFYLASVPSSPRFSRVRRKPSERLAPIRS